MAHLRSVAVFFDGRALAKLEKDRGAPAPLGVPRGLKVASLGGMMVVKAISSTRAYFICWFQ